ncbi:MAG: glycosyltransferase [Candidatus Eremiobacteraeota bacterium]|nr:glycosyltransferase [Candidatus Eremiobacteraeota bacterium]
MPFRNEAAHLPSSLASLALQDIGVRHFRLVAVDNGSSDGGGALLTDFCMRHGIAFELIRAEQPSIPLALNRALDLVAADELVVRFDAHTTYAPDYLRVIEEAFERLGPEVWCVGGSPTVVPPPDFSRALHAALLSSPMGLGPADYRSGAVIEKAVQTIYLGAWRPGVLQGLGGFDERWKANEDSELNERIRERGGSVYRIAAHSQKIVTRGALAAATQWARYGFWRAQTFRRHPSAIRLRHVVPPAALLLGAALALSRARLLLGPLYLAYIAATYATRPADERPAVTLATFAYFPLVQCGYALGLIAGVVAPPAPPTDCARAH